MKKPKQLYVLLCVVFLPLKSFPQTIIASFENQEELRNTYFTEGVELSLSSDFPALEAYSCKAVFPENGGAFCLTNIQTSTLRNIENSALNQDEALLYFIWTNEMAQISLILEDSFDHTFTKQYALKQGANHVQLQLCEAKMLDLKRLKSIGIRTNEKHVFYLDYVALDQYQPVLVKLGRWDVPYTTDIKSSHYGWGSDLANGPIKSYSISPVFDGRGLIELADRLDLEVKVTTIGRSPAEEKYGYGDFYMRRSPGYEGDSTTYNLAYNYIADDLLYSPEFDVIIWPGLHKWESYPQPIRDAILKRVNSGTGLLLLFPLSDKDNSDLYHISPLKSTEAGNAQKEIKDSEIWSWPDQLDMSEWSPTKQHFITRGVAFEAFPWDHLGIIPYQNNQGEVLLETGKGNPVLAVRKQGKGRIVAMSYPERGLLPRVDDPWLTELHYPYWEYMWSLVARAVIWASDKEPGTYIQEASRTPDGLTIQLKNVIEDVVVAVQIIDEFGMIEEEFDSLVCAKQTQVDFPINRELNGGNHIANIQLKGKQGVFDWYSLMFRTNKAVEIISVENRELEIPIGENVRSSIVLKSDDLVKGTLTARLYDNFDRLVDEQSQEVSFQGEKIYGTVLSSENILTHLGKSEYFLYMNDNQTDRQVTEHFFLHPRSWDDYDVTMYHFGPDPLPGTWPATDRQLKELNVTTLAAYTLSHSWHANYRIQAQTRIKGVESPDSGPDLEYYLGMKKEYLETNDKGILKRKYGLKDTVYLNSVRDDLTSMISRWKKFSPSAYYIYEEPSVTRYDDALDLCFRESTLAAMREWLKEEYMSLPALNTQWGTDFTRWEDVVPDDSREARERGNYSSWGDHRTFMEICWADQFKFVQDIVNEVDPGGLVQLSGTQAASSHNGYDYSRLNRYIGQMNPYDIDNQLEYHHNFNPELKISGQAGYGALGKSVLYDYYNHLFLKETGGSYVFWQVSCLNPDLRICQSGLDMKEGFDELLKRGIGRLVDSYEPDNELKIAIHFSYPSIHGAWIVDGIIVPETGGNTSETLKQFNRNRDGWVKLLHDAGLGFDFISYSSIENGNLLANGYKVLILPMSYAMSDSEVQQIEAFVKQGGILIADALPGIMDDHTKIRSKRALSDVFGIKARSYTREELITPAGESKLKVREADILQPDRNVPAILHHQYGLGSAYLLNYFMDNYPEEKLNNNHESSLQKIRKLFAREGLESGILFTTSTGDPANGIEKYSFSQQSGSTRLLGILPGKTGEDKEINLHLIQSAHLYDIRNKEYLGEGNDFIIKVKPSVPELFALVQGTVDDIEVEAPTALNRGEKVTLVFKIIGEGTSDLKSVVRVNVFDPKGANALYYSDNCEVTNGVGTHTFTTALNDQPGLWKIQLTEVISGMEKEVTVSVIAEANGPD
jgi:hypothetical protein